MLSSPTTIPPKPLAIVHIGDRYQGTLQPTDGRSPDRCYQLPAGIGKDLRLDLLKTANSNTIRLSLYDLQPKKILDLDRSIDSVSNIFSIPNTKVDRLLCLATTNRRMTQQYEFRLVGDVAKPIPSLLGFVKDLAIDIEDRTSKSISEIKDKPSDKKDNNPVAIKDKPSDRKENNPVAIKDKPSDKSSMPTPPIPPAPPTPIAVEDNQIANKPQPDGCYIGTWQIEDLSQYWLPTVQTLTQANIENPIGSGNAKLTFTADGKTQFDAKNFQQKYTLKNKTDRRAIDEIDLKLQGQATATYQVRSNSSLVIANQTYDRLNTQLQLATGLELTGGNLFRVYGDTNTTPTGIPYQCVDARRMKLFVPAPTRNRLLPINLRRV